jgi:hypothetical protein
MTDAELFLKYNYTETKDMCLHFLTLVTAVLAFSLSFAEKVSDFQHAGRTRRLFVIVGWCSYLFSIILCGLGLTLNSLAGGDAVYGNAQYRILGEWSYLFIILAGFFSLSDLFFRSFPPSWQDRQRAGDGTTPGKRTTISALESENGDSRNYALFAILFVG